MAEPARCVQARLLKILALQRRASGWACCDYELLAAAQAALPISVSPPALSVSVGLFSTSCNLPAAAQSALHNLSERLVMRNKPDQQ